MARPIVTVPPVTILMEMAGYGSLTEWLARPAILVAGVCRNQWKVLVNHFSSHFRTGRTRSRAAARWIERSGFYVGLSCRNETLQPERLRVQLSPARPSRFESPKFSAAS
jgi:hypothetical protein